MFNVAWYVYVAAKVTLYSDCWVLNSESDCFVGVGYCILLNVRQQFRSPNWPWRRAGMVAPATDSQPAAAATAAYTHAGSIALVCVLR